MNKLCEEIKSMSTEETAEVELILAEVRGKLAEDIKDPGCLELINTFISEYGVLFASMIGSARHHHNIQGGLLNHTLEVYDYALNMSILAEVDIDKDILLTGAFLHDIGKIVCYDYAPLTKTGRQPKWKYAQSEQAKSMGHFGEAISIISGLISKFGISIDKNKLEGIYHIIASHHGETRFGWGSIVNPETPEAWIVFLSDMASSKLCR